MDDVIEEDLSPIESRKVDDELASSQGDTGSVCSIVHPLTPPPTPPPTPPSLSLVFVELQYPPL